MKKLVKIFLLLNLLCFQNTFAQFHLNEKKVSKNQISKSIIDYVNENYKGNPVKYYKLKTDNEVVFFEAKIKSKQGKINLIFDKNGQFVRTDKAIHYLEISEDIRALIHEQIIEEVDSYRITHCRNQRMVDERTYELDVKAKKKNYKFRFKDDGTLIEYKVIPEKPIGFIFH